MDQFQARLPRAGHRDIDADSIAVSGTMSNPRDDDAIIQPIEAETNAETDRDKASVSAALSARYLQNDMFNFRFS